MKKYLSIFRIRFIAGLQYRAAAIAGLATQFAWGGMSLLMFRAFYSVDASSFPMTFPQLAAYIWLQQAFLALFFVYMDNDIFAEIIGGNIAYELARPMDLYFMWFTRALASRAARAFLRCVPVLAVAALLPAPYGLTLPKSPAAFALFLVTMVTGALTVVSFCMLIYCSTFFTMSPTGVRIIAISATEFLSGALIPIPFMPDAMRNVIELTPFAAMQNLPLRIYGGHIAVADAWPALLVQIFWLLAMALIGKLWMGKALKKVVVQGG